MHLEAAILYLEKRRSPRYSFIASAELIEEKADVRIASRVSELSLHGCYLDMMNPFPTRTMVLVKIPREMRCSKPSQRSFIRSRIWVLASGSCMSNRMRKPCWNAGWMERRRTTRGSPDNPVASIRRNTDEKDSMKEFSSRREFLRAAALTGAGSHFQPLVGASNKSVLVFTKSSGFEHAVVKRVDGSRASWTTP